MTGDTGKSFNMSESGLQTRSGFFRLGLFTVFIIAWFVQNNAIFSWDVSWLLEVTRRWLNGGTYGKDFFENNPPLILYLYTPAVLAAKLFHLSFVTAFRLYIFLLVGATLFIVNFFLGTLLKNEPTLRKLILISLSAMAVVFPNYELGQRDPLMAVLILPYALLICYRLQGHEPKKKLAILVGLMAACGIGLKPIFLIPWLLLESYYYSQHRGCRKIMRSEFLTITGFFASYATLLVCFYPQFLTVVAPFCWRWIHRTTNMPLNWLFTSPAAVYSYFILLFFAIQYHYSQNKNLINVLAVLTLGTLFTFIFQRNFWWYHQLPLYTYDVLLSVVLFYQYINQQTVSQREQIVVITYLTAFTICLNKSFPQMPFLVTLSLYEYFTFFSVLIMASQLSQRYLILWLGALLFIHPFILTVFDSGHTQASSVTSKLTRALQPYLSNKSVYVLSSHDILPHKNLPDTIYASRFPAFWLATGMYTPDYPTDTKHLLEREADRNFLINMVAEDLNEKKPDIVLVDLNQHKTEFCTYAKINNSQTKIYFDFDFIKSFSANPNFKTAFKAYHRVRTINPQYNAIAIFERSSDPIIDSAQVTSG